MFLKMLVCLLCFVIYTSYILVIARVDKSSGDHNKPTITVVILVRNKAHALAYFFGYFEKLNYPKDKITLWISCDHNVDNSSAILREWVAATTPLYGGRLSLNLDNVRGGYYGERGPLDWTKQRFTRIMKLRQQALEATRKSKSDFILFLDADVLLENPEILNILIKQNKTIVGPMLTASTQWPYSNFWGEGDAKGYYKSSHDYQSIVKRDKVGCFPVYLVHTVILVDLRQADSQLVFFYPPPYGYSGPHDDVIIFAFIIEMAGLQMHVLNTNFFGHMSVPRGDEESLDTEIEHFRHTKLEVLVQGGYLELSKYISRPEVTKDTLGFDKVYVINLKRRPLRRVRMFHTLHELGVNFEFVNAVDGWQLNETFLWEKGIRMLPSYQHPETKSVLRWGEIGCFLSHYGIWKKALAKKYQRIMILEDNVRVEVLFRDTLHEAIRYADKTFQNSKWDLMYIGRKIIKNEPTIGPDDDNILIWPMYSRWLLGYVLTSSGMKKLVNGHPLGKLVPVDEYISILFNRHDRKDWMAFYQKRDLIAISVNPLLLSPEHSDDEKDFFSDIASSDEVPMFAKMYEQNIKL